MKIFNWIFSIFCILCLPVFGLHAGSVLMFALGIISLPIKAIRNIWENLPSYKILRPLIIGILFVAFAFMIPTDNADSNNIETTKDSTVIVKSTEESSESEKQTKIENEQVETEEPTTEIQENVVSQTQPTTEVTLSVADIPTYSGKPYVEINNNVPNFLESDSSTVSYEYYSEMDELGRCGVAYACIGTDLMPTEERSSIGDVKPTGWHTVKYDVIDGNYLYNRCHLIGYQLSGENANAKNLITGTRHMNVEGMLPFENMVADYVQETGNHVMYRVTPIFDGDNLLASGVQMEAKSVEDNGNGILFNVYCYNVQPSIEIDYATGDSKLIDNSLSENDLNSSNDTSETVSKDSNNSNNENNNSNESTVSSSSSDLDDSSDTLVWKSETGSKYHSINNCGNMNPNKATQITEEQAISQGLGKCSKCW